MIFCGDTSLKDLSDIFDGVRLISGGDYSEKEQKITLDGLHKENPTWSVGDMCFGLNHLYEIKQTNRKTVFPVYSADETGESPDKADVTLLYCPAKQKAKKAFALLLSGGAYSAVCTLCEGLPVAARLNELGIDAFCLNYRTATRESFHTGLMPKPIEDVAAALRLIRQNFPELNGDYFVGGFSAGAHLATLWGTKHLGASSFYEPQPKMLMLAYPLFSLLSPSEPIKQLLIRGLFGENGTQEDAKRYCAAYSMDEEYPPVYIVRAEDDQTVTVQDTQLLLWALDNAGVEYRYEKAPSGGHGFGLGTETPFFGWLERAMEYYEIIRNNR